MNIKRRMFLKGSLAGGTIGVAVSAGLLTPRLVLAAWPKDAMESKGMDSALAATGMGDASMTDKITIDAPDIAENGAVVPVTVGADIEGVTNVAIFAKENGNPLTSSYILGKGTYPYISSRIKVGKTSDVIVIMKTSNQTYMNLRNIKVTVGGCGG